MALIIVASASYYASKSTTPLYSTKTTLMVGCGTDDPNPEFYEINTSRFLANTYVELVKREPVLQGAIDSLGLDMNWRGLAGSVSAKKVPKSQLSEINIIDKDPYRSKVLSDAIANQLFIQCHADPSDIDQEQVLISENPGSLEHHRRWTFNFGSFDTCYPARTHPAIPRIIGANK